MMPIAGTRRRLADDIGAAFHAACDLHDFEVAEQLLIVLQMLESRRMGKPPEERRRDALQVIGAAERLFKLRRMVRALG